MNKVKIDFIPKSQQHSEYDWANISVDDERVGKVRCKIDENCVTIFSINVFPEFEGHGYGKAFVEFCKENYDVVVADRVRFNAIGFWEKTGFVKRDDGNYEYKKLK
jgi:GNAT superfamily N-acetyltransferase